MADLLGRLGPRIERLASGQRTTILQHHSLEHGDLQKVL